MKNINVHLFYWIVLILSIGMCIFIVLSIKQNRDIIKKEYAKRQAAAIQCKTWADRLGGEIKETGEYVRFDDSENTPLPERDPWGSPIKVMYSNSGIKDILRVISAGNDGKIGTRDDIIEIRQSIRFLNINRKDK
jgi:hypothetical protein